MAQNSDNSMIYYSPDNHQSNDQSGRQSCPLLSLSDSPHSDEFLSHIAQTKVSEIFEKFWNAKDNNGNILGGVMLTDGSQWIRINRAIRALLPARSNRSVRMLTQRHLTNPQWKKTWKDIKVQLAVPVNQTIQDDEVFANEAGVYVMATKGVKELAKQFNGDICEYILPAVRNQCTMVQTSNSRMGTFEIMIRRRDCLIDQLQKELLECKQKLAKYESLESLTKKQSGKKCNPNTKSKDDYVAETYRELFPYFKWQERNKVPSNDCSIRRRPDYYTILPNHILIMEVDEEQHKSYDPKDENIRNHQLSESFNNKPIVYIRFNPDAYESFKGTKIDGCFNKVNGKLIVQRQQLEKRLMIVHFEVLKWCNWECANKGLDNNLMKQIYLFYDNYDCDF